MRTRGKEIRIGYSSLSLQYQTHDEAKSCHFYLLSVYRDLTTSRRSESHRGARQTNLSVIIMKSGGARAVDQNHDTCMTLC